MIYREAGQFKTSYQADNQIFPIRQDRLALTATLLVAVFLLPYFASPYMLSAILIPFLIFALAALGLNILTGYAGQLSLGTAAFMAVGAFASYNFMARLPGLPLLVSFILGGLCAAMVGIAFGLPSLRIRGFYLAASTLATQFFVVWCLTKIPYLTNYSSSGVITVQKMTILGYQFDTPQSKYLLVLAIVAGMALLAKNMIRSNVGRSWMAVRDMDMAAEVIGFRLMRTKLLAFRRQLVLLRRGRRPVCVCLPGHGGAGSVQPGPVLPHPVHDHHRRRRLHSRLLPGRGLHRAAARLPEHHRAWPGIADQRGLEPGTDGVRRADHLLPDRRTTRPGQAVADREGEIAPLAFPALEICTLQSDVG